MPFCLMVLQGGLRIIPNVGKTATRPRSIIARIGNAETAEFAATNRYGLTRAEFAHILDTFPLVFADDVQG